MANTLIECARMHGKTTSMGLPRLLSALACIASMTSAAVASARSTYPGRIPNGTAADEQRGGCITCHESALGGDARNVFGVDVDGTLSGGLPDWAALCGIDSDDDGQSNGQELGDPQCVWTLGAAPARTANISRPGDASTKSADPSGVDEASSPGGGDGGDDGPQGCTAGRATPTFGFAALVLLSGRRRRGAPRM